jgi:putative flavoprotein involved in K+ transport
MVDPRDAVNAASSLASLDDNRRETMERTEHTDVLIVGAGQAGLSVAHRLQRQGQPFVIVEAHKRVGDSWRRRWDSLRLYSPARRDGLPGMKFPAPGTSYPTRDQMADYLEAYASRFGVPVRTETAIVALEHEDGRYVARTADGRFEAETVVVASGVYRKPHTPDFAAELDPRITQLHSNDYRNPSQLQPGSVLVVGASHSGSDLAFEAAQEHEVILAGPDTGQLPAPITTRRGRTLFYGLFFVGTHVLTVDTPPGRKMKPHIRHAGALLLKYRLRELRAAGVERVFDRVVGMRAGLPELENGRVLDVANVVWCTGFELDYSWIRFPLELEDDGYPKQYRGVASSPPGLYFVGLPFLHSFTSMLIGGMGRDAERVARHIASQRQAPAPTAAAQPVEAQIS